ncbi:LCP family protein [[Ruminococcus] torques]|uniref:LCP family protein n=1 Tax=[Ruminococcus] torques TaxID=33039 RepID=UPI0025A46670|nr:LCP family protein [[Ruminococcus] torques]MDM8235216.1 LCP family protein [[Ruminococcus] torques]
MSKNVRRRGRRRARAKKGNWFTRMKMWQRVLLITACVLLCAVFGAVAYVYAKWSKIDTQDIKAEDIVINEEVKMNKEVDLGDGYTNVALFGVDSRDGNLGEGNRTDCIIVASLNNETKEIKMVSVYRDTLLDLSEGTYQKCNAAYSYGGPVLAINMLNMNLDLDIQDYVTVDFGAIADAIDLLGGVDIEVTEEELPYINQYIPETANSAGKSANYLSSAGLQTLDGTQATTYARIRSTAGGDFTRTERQRLVIEKMFEKAKSADLGTLNAIIDKVFPQVSTSFTLQEILTYATAYSEYKLVGNMGFPQDNYMDLLSGLGSVVVPDDLVSNVTKLHEFLFGTTGYTPSSTVQTVNSNIAYTVSSAQSSGESYDDGSGTYDDSGYTDGSGDYSGGDVYVPTDPSGGAGTGGGTTDPGTGGSTDPGTGGGTDPGTGGGTDPGTGGGTDPGTGGGTTDPGGGTDPGTGTETGGQ